MGIDLNVHCENCGLSGERIAVGSGMHSSWQFFEMRVFYCPRCETLRSARVLQYAWTLKASLDSMDERPWSTASMGDDGKPATIHLTPSELAKMLLEARHRPRCKCKAALHGSIKLPATADGKEAAKCPHCGEVSLVAVETGLWD